MIKVHMLPAKEGDFFWIEYGKDKDFYHILVDGGVDITGNTFAKIIMEIDERGESIEALILTHIDYDHIQGVTVGLEKIEKEVLSRVVKRIIFNTSKGIRNKGITTKSDKENWEEVIRIHRSTEGYGVGEAISLIELIKEKGLIDRLIDYVVSGTTITTDLEAQIKIISPNHKTLEGLLLNWENYNDQDTSRGYASNLEMSLKNLVDLQDEKLGYDSSVNNKSSIAFIFEFDNFKLAFLGDSVPSICIKGLKEHKCPLPYKVDAIKISHHGSRNNTSDKLLKALPTDKYMISTNGKGKKVPSKVVLAHILKCFPNENMKVYCNYKWWENEYSGNYFTDDDKHKIIGNKSLDVIHLSTSGYQVSKGMVFYGRYKAN